MNSSLLKHSEKEYAEQKAALLPLLLILKSKDATERQKAATQLRQVVELASRKLSAETFSKFINQHTPKIFALIQSQEVHEQLGGLTAIDELIDVSTEDDEAKIIRFSNYLRNFFVQPLASKDALEKASKVLGHLARAGGTLTADFVDFEVKRALEWLQGERQDHYQDHRRLSACLVLKEMARNAPTLFYVNVPNFFETIWVAVRDNKEEIRLAAAEALSSCLNLIAQRQTRHRVQWYYKIYEQVQKGFMNRETESVHGSLLIVGELLRNTGDFMVPRFKEVCDTVLKYKDSRDKLVRRTVITLLPRLAKFCPDAFVRGYLDICLTYLIKSATNANERSTAYLALGKLSLAVGLHIVPQLDTIVGLAKDGMTISRRNRTFCAQALSCVAFLSQAVGDHLIPYMDDLLEQMVTGGLSEELISALSIIVQSVPSYLITIQERLIGELSLILSKRQFVAPGGGRNYSRYKGNDIAAIVAANAIGKASKSRKGSKANMSSKASRRLSTATASASASVGIVSNEGSGRTQAYRSKEDRGNILLALQTLESFNFQGVSLLPFAKESVVPYLDDEDFMIRNQAALTCSRLLLPRSSDGCSDHNLRFRGPTALLVTQVLERMLMAGVADPTSLVRKTVIASLDSRFDAYLCKAEHLQSLFVGLNDESFEIREVAIQIIGRLAPRNPAFIMPALRKTLIQLLTELRYTEDMRIKEESTKLLGYVIQASQRLIQPYLEAALAVLLPKLGEGNAGLASAVLVTLGKLAVVAGPSMVLYEEKLTPLIIETLQDHSSVLKREVAMRTLGQLVGSTGSVIRPYIKYPKLLEIILELLHHGAGSPWSLRKEALKTMGILGALDPYKHKVCQIKSKTKKQHHGDISLAKEPEEVLATESFVYDGVQVGSGVDLPYRRLTPIKEERNVNQLTPSSEDYYPTVATTALVRILRDPSLSVHHNGVIQAIMFIFKSLGLRCVPFLNQIIPPFLHVMRNCEHGLRESLFQQLASLVSIVKQHLRPFLVPMFDLIRDYWDQNLEQILSLVEEISVALQNDLKSHLPELIPLILKALLSGDPGHSNNSSKSVTKKNHVLKLKILNTIIVFGKSVEEYMYLLVPALVRLLEQSDDENEYEGIAIKAGSLEAIARLCQTLGCFSDYASRIIHPLARTIEKSHSPKLQHIALEVLCALVYHLQQDYLIFEPMMNQILRSTDPSLKNPQLMEKYYSVVEQAKQSHIDKAFSCNNYWGQTNSQAATLTPQNRRVNATRNGAASGALGKSSLTFVGSVLPSRQPNAAAAAAAAAAIPDELAGGKTLHVNQQNLRRAWEASQRSTKEDWVEWMRRFSVELLRESPSPALRSCSALAQVYHPLARELFKSAFVSCWTELYEQYQDYLVRALETAFQSESIPPDILQTLLNLAEFMEHDVEALPIDIRQLGELAEKCHAYAKALHYKELEFHTSPSTCIEALISINNQLGQPEAAVGILKYAQQHHATVIEVKESWLEKLQNWSEALELYNAKYLEDPTDIQIALGRMRCLEAMGEWDELAKVSEEVWRRLCDDGVGALPPGTSPFSGGSTTPGSNASLASSNTYSTARIRAERKENDISIAKDGFSTGKAPSSADTSGTWRPSLSSKQLIRQEVAMLGARASWSLADWDKMTEYVGAADQSKTQTCLYRTILAVYQDQFELAEKLVDETRRRLDTQLAALVGESYNRAYNTIVVVQQLAEIEEIISYKRLHLEVRNIEEASRYRRHLIKMWKERLRGCKSAVEVWQHLLAVRSLIISPHEDIDTWLQFASLCRKSGNLSLSFKVLTGSLGIRGMNSIQSNMVDTSGSNLLLPRIFFSADKKDEHMVHLQVADSSAGGGAVAVGGFGGAGIGYGEKEHHRVAFAYLKHLWAVGECRSALEQLNTLVHKLGPTEDELRVRGHLKLGEWQLAYNDQDLDQVNVADVLGSFRLATELDDTNYKAWHTWALMNFRVVEHLNQQQRPYSETAPHVVPAIEGFFRSIALGRSRWAANVQQDILRLMTLWFAHGHRSEVHAALMHGFDSINIETWLGVIPQLIARIHTPHPQIQRQLHQLLSSIGEEHPQALIYPLSVALKSPLQARQMAAESIMATMRRHFVKLVDQALLVSRELIRVAILWHEMWHEGLEEASRLYFGVHDIDGMLSALEPLHRMMNNGPETLREVSFQQAYGRDLAEAHEWIKKYQRSGRQHEGDLNHAWDLYYHVFRRINKQLPQLTTLELQYVSPALLDARNLELAVPGTYHAGASGVVRIVSFVPTVHVITSKQRPRKITMIGNDGFEHVFLLKGHEDLRQDERVMQLFGLVNALLINDRTTSKRELKIQRYSVIPLSHNAGVVGWVPNCDTLHQLIRDYREARKILLNIEHRLMLQMAPDYDNLSLMQKVEVFEYALENTAGQDLYKVLWLKSQSSEVWLDRRTNYTRSLAVMSMVGYILGLGDRHPSNLMLDRFTGTIVHIDFGDCFEVAMHREKYPEKIPFRLTRMLTNAMEVSGIEGNFRYACESVMHVLRDNRDSLMAMLEAFVYDPLICWRLLAPNNSPPERERSLSVDLSTADLVADGNVGIDTAGVPDTHKSERAQSDSVALEYKANLRPPHSTQPGNKKLIEDLQPKEVPLESAESLDNSDESLEEATSGLERSKSVYHRANYYHEMSSLAASVTQSGHASLTASLMENPPTAGVNVSASTSLAQSGVHANRSHREKELVHALGPEGTAAPREALNEKAVTVIHRVQSKLTGRDFDQETLDVPAQVQRLIGQAASHENLCQCYIGWCPFW